MGFRANPENWLPMGQYLRLCWYFLTTPSRPTPYDDMYKSEWDRRWSKVKTLDGPIHTIWVRWTGIKYNWFTIGLVCWRKGHIRREQHITIAPDWDYLTGKWKKSWSRHYIVSCARCGKYHGAGKKEYKREGIRS